MQRLYVSNLPFKTDDTDLLNFAADKGVQVENARVITDSLTGRSRGFGFINIYGDRDALLEAISRLDGSYMDGRSLKVAEARSVPSLSREFSRSRRDAAVGD